MPPNIPDVQSIEKMHFMNCHSQEYPPVLAATAPRYVAPTHPLLTSKTVSESTQTPPTDNVTSPPISNKNKQADCDMGDQTMIGGGAEGEGIVGEEEERPPPVVILSGIGNKEVTGLVFGFDVNEQLLHDDICEDFVARFVAPQGYTQASHNHDKIVNFIGSSKLNCLIFFENLVSGIQKYVSNLFYLFKIIFGVIHKNACQTVRFLFFLSISLDLIRAVRYLGHDSYFSVFVDHCPL